MKVLRIYLKINGNFVDIPSLPDELTMQMVVAQWKQDGYLTKPSAENGAPFAVPWDAWAFAALLTLNEETTFKGASFVYTPGKPN